MRYFLISALLFFSCSPESSNESNVVSKVSKLDSVVYYSGLFIRDDDIVDSFCVFNKNGKKGINFYDGSTGNMEQVGGGISFFDAGDDFSWADTIYAISDTTLYFNIYDEAGDVLGFDSISGLPTSSVVLKREEEGQGIIFWYEGKLNWANQAD